MGRGAVVRYAVAGLGWIAQQSVLPAFRNAGRNSRLVALVSREADKRQQLAERYDVPITCDDDGYDALLESGDVDAVFIALPNHLHADYSIRAARRGVHVLCEKPMAVTSDECRAMITAAREHDVRLMIAYRLHFEAANLRAVERIAAGDVGEPRLFASLNTQNVEAGDIRLKRATGGGTLPDIGLYCINAARYLFRAEPTSGWATGASRDDERFREVAEMTSAVLHFPGERLATFACSFGSASASELRVIGTKAELRVENAYAFKGDRRHVFIEDDDVTTDTFSDRDQFGPQLLYFSDCVRDGREPEPDGEEGLIDTLIIEGLHRSMETGNRVEFEGLPQRTRRPTLEQEIHCPPVHEEEMIGVRDPTS
jgi:predicted dehydrogenase